MIANPSAACLPIRLLVRLDRDNGNCQPSIAMERRKAGRSYCMDECAILNLFTARPRGEEGGGGEDHACMHEYYPASVQSRDRGLAHGGPEPSRRVAERVHYILLPRRLKDAVLQRGFHNKRDTRPE